MKEISKLCSAPVLPAMTLAGGPFDGQRNVAALCVTTFKRNFQAQASLPVNLALTWGLRNTFFWCVVDFNSDHDLADHLLGNYSAAMTCGRLRYFRPERAWEAFHCPTAKTRATRPPPTC